ncbi:hypothetical protein ACFQU2_02650 [Siccirubricoccus deserti]
MDGLIMQVTQRIDSIEVKHLARAEGRSNYTLKRLVLLWLNLATNFSVLPLRLAILAGVVMGILGLAGAVMVVLEAVVTGTPSGWASSMMTTLLVAGVHSSSSACLANTSAVPSSRPMASRRAWCGR